MSGIKGVQRSSSKRRGPGVNGEPEKEQGEVKETSCRAIAARGNYLAQDRPDTQFAAKEVSSLCPNQRPGIFQGLGGSGDTSRTTLGLCSSTSSKNYQKLWLRGWTRISPDVGDTVGACLAGCNVRFTLP